MSATMALDEISYFDSVSPPTNHYTKADFFETPNGNKVSTRAHLCGDANIIASGNTIIQSNSMIRGDLSTVRIGRYSSIGEKTILRPPFKRYKTSIAYFPQHIGSHVLIGRDCLINAASIGDCVQIGDGCIIGPRCAIKECALIQPGTVLSPDTVVPPFAVFTGNPGRQIGDLPECAQELMIDRARAVFESFVRDS